MEIAKIKTESRRSFSNAVCLMSIIPTLVFMYLLVGKIASFTVLAGEIGYILLTVIMLILLGIVSGKKMLWVLINKLIDFSEQIIKIEQELVEKKRLAAISETALSLSHEINNPLLVMQGNLALLEGDFAQQNLPEQMRKRIIEIKDHCERIVQATDKMSKLTKPVSVILEGRTKFLDLDKSE